MIVNDELGTMEEGTGRGLFNISELVWVNVEKS
jgi:hypothetical protein